MARFAARFLAGALLLALAPAVALAVPASPRLYQLTQADGSAFLARQVGDEFSHGWVTDAGHPIVLDRVFGSWTYADVDSAGAIVSSGRLVGVDEPLAGADERVFEALALARGVARVAPEPAPVPVGVAPIGTANVPVILVNFNNTTPTYSTADFSRLLFDIGAFSMRDYYQEVSYGQLTVTSPASIPDWTQATGNHDYYGANDATGSDRFPGTLVRQAISGVDDVVNFDLFDKTDCVVDVVNIVHQGTGEEDSAIATDIWSHSWDLDSAFYYGNSDGGAYQTNDACSSGPGNVWVNRYVIQPEKSYNNDGTTIGMSTVGVFAHEFGHALGLPDLYDTDGSSTGTGYWSVMGSGSWGWVTKFGDRPVHADPWSKWYLGWIAPTTVVGTATAQPIVAATDPAADVYQLGLGSTTAGQYFLVENRHKTADTFDEGMRGEGLLIWHIDASLISARMGANTVNNSECYTTTCTGHYGVSVEQADGLYHLEHPRGGAGANSGDAGDPFPGTWTRRTFDNTTVPNSRYWNGAASGVAVTNVSDSAATMTADLAAPGVPVVTVVANDPTATEAGPTTGQFTIARTGSTAAALAVYFTVGGTATSGSDFTALRSPVTIPAGAANVKVTVTPVNDTAGEDPETVVVALVQNPAYSTYDIGAQYSDTVTIISNDLPRVTIAATDATATEAGPTTALYTITRTPPLAAPLTVVFAVTGTAKSGLDYTPLGTSVVIPALATSAALTLTPIDDTECEANETVIVTLATNAAYTRGTPYAATATIVSDDPPTVTIVANDPTATEAGPTTGQWTVKRTGPTTTALTVNVTVGGTATEGSDYKTLARSVVIPVGAASKAITLTPINDTLREVPETVVVTLAASAAYLVGSPSNATVSILSDEAETVWISSLLSPSSVPEGASMQLTLTRTMQTDTRETTVPLVLTGTARSGLDYTIGAATFAAGEATTTVTVATINDTECEATETVIVTVAASAGFVRGTPYATSATITSDDLPTVTVVANDPTATEAGPTTGQYTVKRTGPATWPALVVSFAVTGSATQGVDYKPLGASVTIAANTLSKTITLTPINDTEGEDPETAVVTLGASPAAYIVGAPSAATVTITSNDLPKVTIAATDPMATEFGPTTGQFTITRTPPLAAALKVYYAVSGTATPGIDYVSIGTFATIPAGEASVPVTVTPIDDLLVEGLEKVVVTIATNAAYARGTAVSAAVAIDDDENPLSGPSIATYFAQGEVLTGTAVMRSTITIEGETPKTIVIRGLGGSLAVTGALANPVIEFYVGSAAVAFATNDDWGSLSDADKAVLAAKTLEPTNGSEAALVVRDLTAGSYTIVLKGAGITTGVGRTEVYDLARR